jgi:hypothetical protein
MYFSVINLFISRSFALQSSTLVRSLRRLDLNTVRIRSGWPAKLQIRIRDPVPIWPLDPGSGAFLTPGSGIRFLFDPGIRCFFDPWIRDPGWVKSQDPDPGWTCRIIFPRSWKQFFGLKYFSSLMRIRIREYFWHRIRNGKIRIRDPQIRNTDDRDCAADFSLLNLPKGKSLGRSKPATNS